MNFMKKTVSLVVLCSVLLSVSLFSYGTSAAADIPASKIKKLSFVPKNISVTVKWKKVKKADGYQLQYSTNKKFSKKKSVAINKVKTVKKTIKNLKLDKTYYFRIRTFKKQGGKKVYSKFSAKKSIKTSLTSAPTEIIDFVYTQKGQSVTLTWNKVNNASGYEIQYSTTPDFLEPELLVTEDAITTTETISRLLINKTYYFRIRSFYMTKVKKKTKTVYSSYSQVKTVETSPYYTTPQALNEKTVGVSTMTSNITRLKYTLKFIDDFDGTKLNSNNWSFVRECAGRAEKQANVEKNLVVRDGNAVLTANKETVLYDQYVGGTNGSTGKTYYTGAKFSSSGKQKFKYGRIEMYAKLPQGSGAWPAFWTMGQEKWWPWGGEIDILEMDGVDCAYVSTIHWCTPDEPQSSAYTTGHQSVEAGRATLWDFNQDKLANAYHVIGLEWTPTRMYFYFDGEKFGDVSIIHDDMSVAFHREHYMIINYALGGLGGTIDDSVFPQNMYVDWVKVWQTN